MNPKEKRDALDTPGEPGDCGNCSKVQCSFQIANVLRILDTVKPPQSDSTKK